MQHIGPTVYSYTHLLTDVHFRVPWTLRPDIQLRLCNFSVLGCTTILYTIFPPEYFRYNTAN